MNSNVYRWCAVPLCKNTSVKSPNKLFINVPLNKTIRNMWLNLARRDPAAISSKSIIYFCEDHFDLPNDMENYIQYHVMGSVSQIRMKPGCIPTRFECQPDRKKLPSSSTKRLRIRKRQRKKLVEAIPIPERIVRILPTKLLLPVGVSSESTGSQIMNEHQEETRTSPKTYNRAVQVHIRLHKFRSKAVQTQDNLVPKKPTISKARLRKRMRTESYDSSTLSASDYHDEEGEAIQEAATSDYMMTPCYLQVCRVCFATDSKLYPMTVYKKLDKAYKMLTGLSIQNEDNLPPYLCAECAYRLLNCIRFRARSLRAHLVMLEVINKHNEVTIDTLKTIVGERTTGSNLTVTHNEVDHYDLVINHDTIEEDIESTTEKIKVETEDAYETISDDAMVCISGMDADCEINDEENNSESLEYEDIVEEDTQYKVAFEDVKVENDIAFNQEDIDQDELNLDQEDLDLDNQDDDQKHDENTVFDDVKSEVQGKSDDVIHDRPLNVLHNYVVADNKSEDSNDAVITTCSPMEFVHGYVPRNVTPVDDGGTSSDIVCGKASSVSR